MSTVMPTTGLVEITTLADFRAIVDDEFGVVVIEDVARPQPVAHHPWCSWVTSGHFIAKVVLGGCEIGHYYWAGDVAAAVSSGARRCGHCGRGLLAS